MLLRFLMLVALPFVAFALAPKPSPSPARPNILFILTDDQRFDTLGCAGHPIVKTPHIDALAARGVRFTNAFVNSPICMASRASIFTSLTQRAHQVYSYRDPIDPAWLPVAYPAQLRHAGYETGFIGKVHFTIAGTDNLRPPDWYDFYQPTGQPYWKTLSDGTRRHETDLDADHALRFLSERDPAKPFCLSISFNSPHAQDGDHRPGIGLYPWPPSTDGLYEDQPMPTPRLGDPAIFDALPDAIKMSIARERFFWGLDTAEKYQTNVRAYFRMITGVDHAVGRIVAELDRLGLRENTLIVFTSDNGYYLGNRGLAGKWLHHDDALRVPLIVVDPRPQADATRGQTQSAIALNLDLAPTLLDYAGVPAPPTYQGRSLAAFLTGTRAPANWRTEFYCEHAYPRPHQIPKWEGIRGTRYAYARYYDPEPEMEFFHDLQTDPDQLNNLARDPAFAELVTQHRQRTTAFRQSLATPPPAAR